MARGAEASTGANSMSMKSRRCSTSSVSSMSCHTALSHGWPLVACGTWGVGGGQGVWGAAR
jgi:hypothetical protein